MSFLNRAIIYLQSTFPEDWINTSFDFSTDKYESLPKIGGLLSDATSELCDCINLSIISGEYIIKEGLKSEIDKIQSILKGIGIININGNEVDDDLSELNQLIYFEVTEFFIKPLLFATNRYKGLCHFIDRKLDKYKSKPVLFDVYQDENLKKEYETSLNPEVFKKIKVIEYNIDLARIDASLTVNEKALSRCLLISKGLSNSLPIEEGYHKVLFWKANFLIYKIIYRYEQDEKNYLYAFDFSDNEIDKNELNVGEFKLFQNITEHHYDDQRVKSRFTRTRIQKFYEKLEKDETPSFSDYHAVIKSYKDEKNSLEQLKNLVEHYCEYFKEFQKSTSLKYDKKAAIVTKHYILNNELSLKIQKGELNLSNWEAEFNNFKNLSSENNLHNFFPYYKFALFISGEIETYVKNENVDLKHLNQLVSNYEEVVKELYKAYEWCVDNRFIAFLLPFEESTIKWKDGKFGEVNVFLYSSFVLPLNYSKIKNEIESIKSDILKFKTILGIQENLIVQKTAIKEIKDDIDKSEKRSIEILSIFSAIVLFVLGDIQIFTKVDNPSRAFQFMLLFAYSLSLFVLLVWLISRPEGFKLKGLSRFQGFVMIFYIIGAIVVFTILNNQPPFNKAYQHEEIEKIKKTLDSTKYQLDSLKHLRGSRR